MTATLEMPKEPKANGKPRVVSTLSEVARHFSVRRDTAQQWKDSGCPGAPGAWDLDAIAAWKAQRLRDPETAAANGQSAADVLQRKRLAEALVAEEKARGLKRENDEAAGNLVAVDDVVAEAAEMFAGIKALLEGIPDAVVKEIDADARPRMHGIAAEIVRMALSKLSQMQLGEGGPTMDEAILRQAELIRTRKNGSTHHRGGSEAAGPQVGCQVGGGPEGPNSGRPSRARSGERAD